jgi:hypothetical protein
MPRAIGALLATIIVLSVGGWIVGLLWQPARIVSKTLDADNVINNYEWFYDAHGNLMARTAQVRQFKKLTESETDLAERNRLRIEMAAIQQSCRDLARRYNANAEKANRSIFMGHGVPSSFNPGECE